MEMAAVAEASTYDDEVDVYGAIDIDGRAVPCQDTDGHEGPHGHRTDEQRVPASFEEVYAAYEFCDVGTCDDQYKMDMPPMLTHNGMATTTAKVQHRAEDKGQIRVPKGNLVCTRVPYDLWSYLRNCLAQAKCTLPCVAGLSGNRSCTCAELTLVFALQSGYKFTGRDLFDAIAFFTAACAK